MSLKMSQWANNRIHCFFSKLCQNWVHLAHFVFWGVQAPETWN